MEEKKCTKCKVVQSSKNFTTDKTKKDNLRSSCNKCQAALAKAWYSKNKIKARAQAVSSYHRNQEKILIRRKATRDKYKDKITAARKEHYKNNKSLYKERSWKSAGIKDMTIHRYDQLLNIQNYSCAICSIHQQKLKRMLNVDHDHITGKVRGLLCDACNRALGYFKDSEIILNNAKNYLICHKTIGS